MDSGKKQEIQCIAFEPFRKSAFSIESPLVFLRLELSPLQGRDRRYRLAGLRRAGTEFLALRSGSPPSPQVHTHFPPTYPGPPRVDYSRWRNPRSRRYPQLDAASPISCSCHTATHTVQKMETCLSSGHRVQVRFSPLPQSDSRQ